MGTRAFLSFVAVFAIGCGIDPVTEPAMEDEGTTSADVGSSESSTGPESGSASTEAPLVERPVLDLRFSRILVNQGVEGIVFDKESIAPTERVPVVAGRPARVDVEWIHWGFYEEREIVGRLELAHADGTQTVLETVQEVTSDLEIPAFDRAFSFRLDAEHLQPGTTLQASLWEAELGPEDGEPPNTAAPDGPIDLGIAPSPTRLKVRLVPMANDVVDLGDCPHPAPVYDDATLQRIEDRLYELFPVEAVELTVRDPISWTGPLIEDLEIAGLYLELADLREADGADPAEHYVAMAQPCTDEFGRYLSPDAGVSILNDDSAEVSEGLGWRRVLLTMYVPELEDRFYEHIGHELGHNLGLSHVLCVGTEEGADPEYPHPAGNIGGRGWGVVDGVVRPPSAASLMSYCESPRWISAYGWSLLHPTLVKESSW